MCVAFFAYKAHPEYPLILASNRDEFFNRPASPAEFWEDYPHVLAGRDLKMGGTWLGVSREGRLAVLTNYRDLSIPPDPRAVSRGKLASYYLLKRASPLSYLSEISEGAARHNNFNLLLGKFDDLFCISSVNKIVSRVKPGIHGLSNSFLNTPWPKVKKGKLKLTALLREKKEPDPEDLLSMLKDREPASDDRELPDTGVGLEIERMLSPIFINSPGYGTRVSTVFIIDEQKRATFVEATFDSGAKEILRRKHQFGISPS